MFAWIIAFVDAGRPISVGCPEEESRMMDVSRAASSMCVSFGLDDVSGS